MAGYSLSVEAGHRLRWSAQADPPHMGDLARIPVFEKRLMDAVRRLKWLARIAAHSQVNDSALRIAVALTDHMNRSTGRCDPSIARLMLHTSKSESSVRRATQTLGRFGFLGIKQSKGGNQQATNQFDLLTPTTADTPTPTTADTPATPVTGERGVTRDGGGVSLVTVEGCHSCDTRTGNRTGNRTGITANAVVDEVAGRKCGEGYRTKKEQLLAGEQLTWFEEFWEAFNLKMGKADAADTWLSLRVDSVLKDKIIVGARREAQARTKPGERGPNPKWAQGWLSGRRWEDEPEGDGNGVNGSESDWITEGWTT